MIRLLYWGLALLLLFVVVGFLIRTVLRIIFWGMALLILGAVLYGVLKTAGKFN